MRNLSQEDAERINEYKEKVEKIREDSFEAILANVHSSCEINARLQAHVRGSPTEAEDKFSKKIQ